MSSPRLSIAINSFKNPELLRLCLESVFRHVRGTDFEILVADSATEESTRLVMEDFPQVRFFPHERNTGFSPLVNRSVKEARGEYLFLINHDIILTEDTIPAFFRFFEENPSVGIAGGRQVNFNGSDQDSAFRFYRPWTILSRRTVLGKTPWGRRHLDWFLMREQSPAEARRAGWIMGSAMFIRREAVEAVGPMDTRFFLYMEDVDWCRRFWEKGWEVAYVPEAILSHYHGKGSARGGVLRSLFVNRLTWYHIISAAKYFLKYFGKSEPKYE